MRNKKDGNKHTLIDINQRKTHCMIYPKYTIVTKYSR